MTAKGGFIHHHVHSSGCEPGQVVSRFLNPVDFDLGTSCCFSSGSPSLLRLTNPCTMASTTPEDERKSRLFDFPPMPKLDSNGSNYWQWSGGWRLNFKYANLWTLVSGSRLRPCRKDMDATWDDDNLEARFFLSQSVDVSLVPLVVAAADAAQAWADLGRRYGRWTAQTLFRRMMACMTRVHEEGQDILQHMDQLHLDWTLLKRQCLEAGDSCSQECRPILDNQIFKGIMLLVSLRFTSRDLINNILAGEQLHYSQIVPKVIRYAERLEQESNALETATKRPQRQGRQPPPQPSSSAGRPTRKAPPECTWCRKRQFPSLGHHHGNCLRLAQHQSRA